MRIKGSTIANKHLSQRILGFRGVTKNKSWDDLPKTAIAQIFTLLPPKDLVSTKNVALSWKEEGQRTIQQAITDFAKVVNNNAISIAEMIKRPKEAQEKCKEFKKYLDIFRWLPKNERTEVSKDIREKFRDEKKGTIDHLLQDLAEIGNSTHVRHVLVLGADINRANEYGETALHKAAYNGHTETVKALLDAGTDVNQTDNEGESALHKATCKENTNIIKILIMNGASVNGADSSGNTALHIAAINGRPKNVKALVKRGADVNWPNQNRETALHIATFNGYAKTVKALLSAGTDVNWLNQYGETALHIAALKGNAKIVKALLSAGADVSLRSSNGSIALDYAKGMEHPTRMDRPTRIEHEQVIEILEKAAKKRQSFLGRVIN